MNTEQMTRHAVRRLTMQRSLNVRTTAILLGISAAKPMTLELEPVKSVERQVFKDPYQSRGKYLSKGQDVPSTDQTRRVAGADRNRLCPCGSGKKMKKCPCLRKNHD